MSFGRAFRLVALALGAVTLVLGVICGVLTFRTRAFLADSTTASGLVIGLDARESCNREEDERGEERQVCSTVYAPRVRFTTADGREIVFVSGTASSPPAYAEGDHVEVRYRAERPADARIDTTVGVWLGTMVTGGLTLVFAGLCTVWIVLAVRFRRV